MTKKITFTCVILIDIYSSLEVIFTLFFKIIFCFFTKTSIGVPEVGRVRTQPLRILSALFSNPKCPFLPIILF